MNILIPFMIILGVACVAVLVFGFSASMVGYGMLKSTAKIGGGSSSSTPKSVPVNATGWTFQYSPNMPATMAQDGAGNYYFDFPSKDGVHCVVKKPVGLTLGQTVTASFEISGSGNVVPVQGGPPGKVSLFMQRAGDNLSAVGPYQQYRYYHSSVPLTNGAGSISAQLSPGNWTDVFGKPGSQFEQQFKDCVANASAIGLVFGDPGAGATAHGAYASGGPVRFTLNSFTIA